MYDFGYIYTTESSSFYSNCANVKGKYSSYFKNINPNTAS